MMLRLKSRQLKIGAVPVGGGAPVSIQSMCNTDTRDADATLRQIKKLCDAGCEIIRTAVPDMAAVDALCRITAESPIPVIADIHFDYKLALASIKAGVHAIRINPGNIGSDEKVALVAEAAGNAGIPLRVGANAGSLPPDIVEKYLKGSALHDSNALSDAIVESVMRQCALLEKFSFRDIKVSLKASDVQATVAAYRKFAERSDYPLHLGITEAGTLRRGVIKSAVGIGALLLDGIGDTIRVSLTADPLEEVKTALLILESCGLRQAMPEISSCPTCGRTEIDLIGLADKVEALVDSIKADGSLIKLRKIAVMGCVVNGPGEARDADLGVAGGRGKFILFKHGEAIATLSEKEVFDVLKTEIMKHVSRT